MSPPSPLSVLSGALKIADKVTVAMEAVGDKIRMSEQDTGLRHAVASDVTRDDFDENLTFGEAGSSSAAKRWHSTR